MNNDFQFIEINRHLADKKDIQQRQTEFVEIYRPNQKQHIESQASRCLDCGNPYCEWKCPLHNYIPNWLQLISENRLMEAADLVHQTNSLPEVCGRVCPQDRLCEGACTLNDDFGAVTIGNIERYITDSAIEQGWKPDLSDVHRRPENVAIIGAGPAGLACADVLARNGITATVYDKYPEIGGLLTYGIPAFKLEKSIIQHRRKILEGMGVKFQLNTHIGVDISFDDIAHSHDAVFLGLGTYKAIAANIPNENAQGVYQALPYLIANTKKILNQSSEEYPFIDLQNQNVVVLGGGDTSMDCVRTAVRQGANKVTLLYRRDEASMPGSANEVANAKEEGVNFIFNHQPIEIQVNDGKVVGVECLQTHLEFEEGNSRPSFKMIEDSNQCIEADAVIVAFGFQPNPTDWMKQHNIEVDIQGRVVVNRHEFTYQTSNPKVFSGGDMVRGADLVVTAIDEGRKAAIGILDFLT
ncbi:FAD-dependent oxidoreductase [Shewanella sp. 202IG2-18]|uniref:FAD-dependent oxidoreductase n=1 Tax=Parashewanella hymeniacidonis TaxID=2807618 RepID=UPI00195FFA51|nr:FAD-dependent oxidoreductase [Parashewanella hymeniacidonis]MBM7074116.1 FAD-dependent oxidoreductase [Parashewanella hymeniacidonis]